MAWTEGSSGAAPKASNFAVACNLLSQYVKERGAAADLGKSVVSMTDTRTMSLLPGVDVGDCDGEKESVRNTMDLFPRFGPSAADSVKKSSIREAGKGQLTIFYAGKVLVFNDFPTEKAEDLMNFAGKGTENSNNFAYTTPSLATGNIIEKQNDSANQEAKVSSAPANVTATAKQGQADGSTQQRFSDLPIARKASLHRFLERRKDRINSRAPYQATGSSEEAIPKSEESKSWLGLSPQVSDHA